MMNLLIIISLFQCVFFALFLLGSKNIKFIANKYLALLLFALAASLADHYFQQNYDFVEYVYLYFIFNFTGLVVAPLLYLYVLAISDPHHRFQRKYSWLFLPYTLLTLFLLTDYHILPSNEQVAFITNIDANAIYTFLIPIFGWLFIFLLMIKTIMRLQLEKTSNKLLILPENKQYFIVLDLVVWSCLLIFVVNFSVYLSKFLESNVQFYQWLNVIDKTLWLFFSASLNYFGLRFPNVFSVTSPKPKYNKSSLTETTRKKYVNSLVNHANSGEFFLAENISLNELATSLQLSPKLLSQVINEEFNCSFFDYVNQLRINRFKELAAKQDNKQSILALALACGFNSKAAFNRAFKKHEGCTPSEYLKKK